MPMSDFHYQVTQTTALTIARMTSALDTKSFVERIVNAKHFGPHVDPFLYRKVGADRIEAIETVAKALDEFNAKVKDVLPRLGDIV